MTQFRRGIRNDMNKGLHRIGNVLGEGVHELLEQPINTSTG